MTMLSSDKESENSVRKINNMTADKVPGYSFLRLFCGFRLRPPGIPPTVYCRAAESSFSCAQ